jgi:hypothetical protein
MFLHIRPSNHFCLAAVQYILFNSCFDQTTLHPGNVFSAQFLTVMTMTATTAMTVMTVTAANAMIVMTMTAATAITVMTMTATTAMTVMTVRDGSKWRRSMTWAQVNDLAQVNDVGPGQ